MRKLLPAIAGAVMMLGMTAAAHATEWIECADPAGEAQIGLLAGGLDFAQFSRAHLLVGSESWSTDPTLEPGTPLAIGDSFMSGTEFYATLTDADRNDVLAELRVFVVSNESGDAKGGVLTVPGKGVWAVSCEGP
jgi:hypothetical protein